MKNIYLLVILELLVACTSKKNDPVPVKKVTITYDFNASEIGSFQIGYVDSANMAANTQFKGTHWVKTITITGTKHCQKVLLAVTAINKDYVGLADARIIVNSKLNADYTYSFNKGHSNFEFYGDPWQ